MSVMAESAMMCSTDIRPSHVPVSAQRLEAAAISSVLRASGALGDVREPAAAEFDDDVVDGGRGGRHRLRAGRASERAVSHAVTAIEVEADDRNGLARDVFP